ncbi:hypothetical protein [Neolewinella agarilytica]|uniref:hypothetical protein n=1 Tax=Neolewinella agarilytica TaxID=478744 RepID=UPI002356C22D|nr:hypothetical protein [Neolewinella agarilytica]
MKRIENTKLCKISGGGWWSDFANGACSVVAAADIGIIIAAATVTGPLAGVLVAGNIACGAWTIYNGYNSL